MKKTILLANLITVVALASTTGTIESYNENEATFVKGAKTTFVAKKTGVKTEVKVEGTGFSFGGDFVTKDLELGKVTKANFLNHSNVWAKYELPELTKGLNIYVKGTISPKFAGVYTYTKLLSSDKVASEVDEIVGNENNTEKAKALLVEAAKNQGFDFTAKLIKESNVKIDALKNLLVEAKKSKISKKNDKIKKRKLNTKVIR